MLGDMSAPETTINETKHKRKTGKERRERGIFV
jgi:hypothetical protein